MVSVEGRVLEENQGREVKMVYLAEKDRPVEQVQCYFRSVFFDILLHYVTNGSRISF